MLRAVGYLNDNRLLSTVLGVGISSAIVAPSVLPTLPQTIGFVMLNLGTPAAIAPLLAVGVNWGIQQGITKAKDAFKDAEKYDLWAKRLKDNLGGISLGVMITMMLILSPFLFLSQLTDNYLFDARLLSVLRAKKDALDAKQEALASDV